MIAAYELTFKEPAHSHTQYAAILAQLPSPLLEKLCPEYMRYMQFYYGAALNKMHGLPEHRQKTPEPASASRKSYLFPADPEIVPQANHRQPPTRPVAQSTQQMMRENKKLFNKHPENKLPGNNRTRSFR